MNNTAKWRFVTFHDYVNKPSRIQRLGRGEHPRGWTSISPPYNSPEEVKRECKIGNEPCLECGNIFRHSYQGMDENSPHCFQCEFWLKLTKNNRLLVIDGRAYIARSSTTPRSKWNGFGGDSFRIKKGDRIIETNNLWHKGDVPSIFRDRLPDNAEFLPKSEPIEQ